MNVLLISEHYYPKVGGTVSYVENTAINLAQSGVNVYLLVPSVGPLKKIIPTNHSEKKLTLLNLGVTENSSLSYNASEREVLCQFISDNITDVTKEFQIEITHVLFGLFVAAVLNTSKLHSIGIKTFHTIHNIPPFECSSSWKGDKPVLYYKDIIRKIGVKLVNRKRIKNNKFDVYITPSKIVKNALKNYLPTAKINVIGHGGAEYIKNNTKTTVVSDSINILTVGGLVPHKNQHLIPIIAQHLKQQGISFKWNILGPSRNQRYVDSIKNEINTLGLEQMVIIKNNVSNQELDKFYQNANLYIQLSSEEGFCMTVLDAIAYEIPVLGTPAGAIPEMLDLSGGIVIENNLDTLKLTIAHYIKIIENIQVDRKVLSKFKSTYTWKNSVEQLIKLYDE